MISDMVSGECRRVSPERPDLHVYCHNPMLQVTTPDGRQAWRRYPERARYCVVCPEEGLEYLPYAEWITADEAETICCRVLYPRAKKRGA